MTQQLLAHLLQGNEALRLLQQVTDALGPFSEAWKPSALAHNDFYDSQVLLTPEGNLALVDFEETGPGDPLLDVGNMLAHLRWMTRFGIAPEAYDSYRRRFRAAALDRFGWDAQALNLREAYALFRLSSNPFRQLQRNWTSKVASGLVLATEVLEGAP
jgi:aminoglycoside phosphotransferase (APT) family kinase protein